MDEAEARIDQILDDPAHWADPGAALRSIDDPRCQWASTNAWVRGRDRRPPSIPPGRPLGDVFHRWMIYTRGDKHDQLRRRFSGYFGPRQAESFRATVEERVDAVLDEVGPRGEMDLVTDLAQQITFPLVADTMGIPEADRAEITAAMLVFEDTVPRQHDPAQVARGEAAAAWVMDLFETYLGTRLAAPGTDFLSGLTRMPLDAGEEWRDVAANCLFLLSNAFVATPTLVAGTLGLLLDHPAQSAALGAGEVSPEEVADEAARLLTPVTLTLSANEADDGWIVHCLAAANRDPAAFPDPDAFDPSRSPNRHLSFFAGPHACLGASVARLIAGIAALRVTARLPDLRRAGPTVWASSAPLHRMTHLPVSWNGTPA